MENIQKTADTRTPHEKLEALQAYLRELGSVVVAFSAGVDSTFLAKAAHDTLGDKMMCVTAAAASFPEKEKDESEQFCAKEGIRHEVVWFDEFGVPGFAENPKDRCYICKKGLFKMFLNIADENGYTYVVEGSNTDDLGDYRPGLIAISELDIKSPLRHAGMTKQDIRILSKEMGLSTWDKPSFACLASRFVYGETITAEKLSMVGRGEQLLADLGFKQMRVRIHGTIARIEVTEEDFPKLISREIRTQIVAKLKKIGFTYVAMDLQGYRTGSMNETLKKE